MTEKRFHKGDWSNNICEVYDDEDYIGGVQLDCADEFISLLNSLNEENEQLKEKNKCLLDNLQSNNEINKEIVEDILKENNQLKQENNDLIKLINDLGNGEMDRQMEEILND